MTTLLLLQISWIAVLAYLCIGLFVVYCGWWIYNSLEEIKNVLFYISKTRYESLSKKIDTVNATVSSARGEVTSSIRTNSQNLKSYITSESSSLRQMIMTHFSSQTRRLVEDLSNNRQALTQFFETIQRLQTRLEQNIQNNSVAIKTLNNTFANTLSTNSTRMTSQIKTAIQTLSNEEKTRGDYSSAAFDTLMRNLYDFNQTITLHLQILEESENKNSQRLDDSLVSLSSSIKSHTETITSNVSHALSSQKELHNRTKSSFDSMNGNLGKYLGQLRQIDNLYNNLQRLYNKLLVEEERINKQETSLTSMVARHSQIFEITSEMNNTSKEILEFMKLYLVQSTLDNFKA